MTIEQSISAAVGGSLGFAPGGVVDAESRRQSDGRSVDHHRDAITCEQYRSKARERA